MKHAARVAKSARLHARAEAQVLAVAFEALSAEVTGLRRAPLLCRAYNTALGAPALIFGERDRD